ncbi:MAG: hypothetical protein PHS30_08685 [Bacteroidales bacterium]|nr:hypothetical protein [Bacteroidales bacterium]
MKQILFIPVFFLVMLVGCTPPVTFNQPQPEGVDNLSAIPKKMVGYYVGKDGITSLTIDRNRIILYYDYEVKQQKDSLNWEKMKTEDKRKFRLEGDSVIEHVTDADTIFCFSEDYVLKKYKGYFFLNSRFGKNSWLVQKIKIQKGLLTIGRISTKEELNMLEKINESPIDTATLQVNFTRKQFHDYIESDGFSKVDTFIRVNRRNK